MAQLTKASLVTASPTATFHDSVQQMLVALQLAERVVLHTRHYGALPDMVTGSDLVAIVPKMYAASLQPRYALRTWELPGHGPRYEVRMLWHERLADDAGHAWLRALVRRLFQRPAARASVSGAARRRG